MSLSEAVKVDRRQGLVALRDELATSIEAAKPSEVAALAKQLRDTLLELDRLAPSMEGDPLDDLAARRSAKSKVSKRRGAGVGGT